ncbi:MAG: hypothetical protein O4859_08230 [Trichodesmium sp. St18_bin1]|nr:hypothetical protein [Trichodesmium sp. St18_bin1]MDE5118830.1 hypothetical protein [Trichodesmium sp. St19_bin1]
MKDQLTQTNVAKILGVSFQRVHTLRIRNRIDFSWDVNKKAWLTSQEHINTYLNQREKKGAGSREKSSTILPLIAVLLFIYFNTNGISHL